jgi:hypothetical protein
MFMAGGSGSQLCACNRGGDIVIDFVRTLLHNVLISTDVCDGGLFVDYVLVAGNKNCSLDSLCR